MPSKEVKPYKTIQKDMDVEDINASLDLIITANKNTMGRPATYPDTQQGLDTFIQNATDYFAYVQSCNKQLDDKHKMIADVEGLAVYCGITRKTLLMYERRSPEWARTIGLFKNQIAYEKKQLALHGAIPSVLAIFDLANNHGYMNTNTFTQEQKNPDATEEDLRLESKLADAGLVWNESTGEYEYE